MFCLYLLFLVPNAMHVDGWELTETANVWRRVHRISIYRVEEDRRVLLEYNVGTCEVKVRPLVKPGVQT